MLRKISSSPTTSFIRITSHVTLVDMVLKLWAMGSACIDPFLNGWLNRPIREAMITLYEIISNSCFQVLLPTSRGREQEINANFNHLLLSQRNKRRQRKPCSFENSSRVRERNRRCQNSEDNSASISANKGPRKYNDNKGPKTRAADVIAIVESPICSMDDLELAPSLTFWTYFIQWNIIKGVLKQKYENLIGRNDIWMG